MNLWDLFPADLFALTDLAVVALAVFAPFATVAIIAVVRGYSIRIRLERPQHVRRSLTCCNECAERVDKPGSLP